MQIIGACAGGISSEKTLKDHDKYIRAVLLFRLLLIARNLTLLKSFDERRKNLKIAIKYCTTGLLEVNSINHSIYSSYRCTRYILSVISTSFSWICFQRIWSVGKHNTSTSIILLTFDKVFGGIITKNGSNGDKISKSLYGDSGYWPLNFNDFASGLGTLFTVLHVSSNCIVFTKNLSQRRLQVNNMHITSSGFEAVTENYKPRIFFISWYCIGVLLLLNVIPAFLLVSYIYLQYLFLLTNKEQFLELLYCQ